MNCKNVEPLLSLYVGRDLEEGQLRLVAAHLQSCTRCALAADEYAGARHLLQKYDPPFFSDEIYAGIREQVLNQLKQEHHPPVWPSIFSKLFLALVQPRMRWITATVLLAITVIALYLNHKPSRELPNDQQVAVGTDVRSENNKESAGVSSLSNKRQIGVPVRRRPITGKRKANAGIIAIKRAPQVQDRVGLSRPSSAPAPLRVEIQTSDRNIRIIWLSGQRPHADGRDGSKGI